MRSNGNTALGVPVLPAMMCCILIAACAGFGMGVAISAMPGPAYHAGASADAGEPLDAGAPADSGAPANPGGGATPALLAGTGAQEPPPLEPRLESRIANEGSEGVAGAQLVHKAGGKEAAWNPFTAPISLAIPVAGAISSEYGFRWGRLHEGIDIASSYGHPVRAAAAGVVRYAGYRGTYGKLVVLRHEQNTETYYGHLSQIMVKAGQKVEKGSVIGRVGSTGLSTGPHLHFEVRVRGRPLDPSYVLGINLT
ncbi:MAG: M23 family metallopeptidase [Firmicutes bacterium]|nr:M23 family metallopeptidase [Bacillota bacterium]